MNERHIEQLESLFDLLERCHTILTDAFPHEGLKKIGGSRIALRGPLMVILKKCVKEIVKELKKSSVDEPGGEVAALWVEVTELLTRIERQDLNKKSEDEINKAATLLYLANGVTWNDLRELVSYEPLHNPQYVRVEPLLPLLKRCGCESDDETHITPKQMVRRIQAELRACLR
jgi:hypothetical protein